MKLISIDPGRFKSGLVLVDIEKQIVDQAIVLNTEFLPKFLKTLKSVVLSLNFDVFAISQGSFKKKQKIFKKKPPGGQN